MHDWLWGFGFDEASGNFQVYEPGARQAGDAVQPRRRTASTSAARQGHAEPNVDIRCLNNANFGTHGDGTCARMQMFMWARPNRSLPRRQHGRRRHRPRVRPRRLQPACRRRRSAATPTRRLARRGLERHDLVSSAGATHRRRIRHRPDQRHPELQLRRPPRWTYGTTARRSPPHIATARSGRRRCTTSASARDQPDDAARARRHAARQRTPRRPSSTRATASWPTTRRPTARPTAVSGGGLRRSRHGDKPVRTASTRSRPRSACGQRLRVADAGGPYVTAGRHDVDLTAAGSTKGTHASAGGLVL